MRVTLSGRERKARQRKVRSSAIPPIVPRFFSVSAARCRPPGACDIGCGAVRVQRLSKPIIGLAGAIGAGKSTVARVFESLGAAVIDSDRLNHEQLRSPEIIETLRSWWGDRVIAPSGQVDRRTVADIVFASPKELKRLQDLTYPRIEKRRNELFGLCDADERVKAIVLDSPKLFDTGLDRLCDAVVFIEADPEKRLQRAAAARGWTREEVTRRENLQNRLDSKRAKADYTVANNSSIDDLRPSIESILASVLASFAADPRGGSSAETASS